MPLKISLSTPEGASLTLEVSERDAYSEIAELVIARYPHLTATHNGGGDRHAEAPASPPALVGGPLSAPAKDLQPPAQTAPGKKVTEPDAFHAFCQRQAPLGDMRRLVVAAEGARLHLGMERVSVRELGALFERAGWPQPKDLVQTIRNAARSSFRWLERIPGREGYYTVSQRGRAAVLK